MSARFSLVLVLMTSVAVPTAAQAIVGPPLVSPVRLSAQLPWDDGQRPVQSGRPFDRMTRMRPRTSYWLEGGIITAIPAIVGFNILYDDDTAGIPGRLLGSAFAGAIFAVPGMVLGGLFPKD
jgi:hypothetical protein